MIILPDLSGRQNPAYRSTPLEVLVRGEADALRRLASNGIYFKRPRLSGAFFFENFLKKCLTNRFLWYIIFNKWEKVGESGFLFSSVREKTRFCFSRFLIPKESRFCQRQILIK